MKLLRLALTDYRGVPNGAWSFTSPHDGAPLDTVYVTGPAASGKTAFLEAIIALRESVGAYGAPPDPARLLRRGKSAGLIEGTWLLAPDEQARAGLEESKVVTRLVLGHEVVSPLAEPGLRALFAHCDHDPARGKLEYFPSNRRIARRGGRKPPALDAEARLRPGKDPDKYAFLEQALVAMALRDGLQAAEEAKARGLLLRRDSPDSLAPYRRELAELAPNMRLGGVELEGASYRLGFDRADGARLTLDDLSDSEQQAFLFATVFRRIGLSRSIVLVDLPELHLPPEAHAGFVRALGLFGADNQLFVATGSPDVLRSVAPHQVVRLAPPNRGSSA
jgi:hypothetical protein